MAVLPAVFSMGWVLRLRWARVFHGVLAWPFLRVGFAGVCSAVVGWV